MAEKSASQRIKELDAERASILGHAKGEALQKANLAVEELNSLGFNYRLVEGAAKGKASKGMGANVWSRTLHVRFVGFRQRLPMTAEPTVAKKRRQLSPLRS